MKIEFIYMICHGVDLNFHVKKGGLKSKYSCAVHLDFYCFASADICRHGLLHVATRVAYTIYSLTDVQGWSLNAPLMLRHFSKVATYGAFILPSLYIGRRLSTSLDVALPHRWAMPQRQDLASLGIGRRCTAMKSECTIMVRSDFIDVHRSTSANASRS